MIEQMAHDAGWQVVHCRVMPERRGTFRSCRDLPLSAASQKVLEELPNGIYQHQYEGLRAFLDGKDVCVATGTASGKSLVFQTAGIEKLVEEPHGKIVAIYPMRALARDQEKRWLELSQKLNLSLRVGRVDGSVPLTERENILRDCQVVLMTPDVMHAWLLSNLTKPAVHSFLAHVTLVIADEVHVYTGVFGTNAAFLFRRFLHAVEATNGGRKVPLITASATMNQPEDHLRSLFSRRCTIIGQEMDTSPRHELTVYFLQPPDDQDINTSVAKLLSRIAQDENRRFLAFADSRKRTELLVTIMDRERDGAKRSPERTGRDRSVMPYRAGYEEEDRLRIQQELGRGELKGVVSTSAMELGLDIPGLTTAVLVGVPSTATSFWQRIGRVGRHGKGEVLVVNSGDFYDETVFSQPDKLFHRPLTQSALYLQNRFIQYTHALCFAAPGGEYDSLRGNKAEPGCDQGMEVSLETSIQWPEGFLEICEKERLGTIPVEFQAMKIEAGDDPWHAFPLREVGTQFDIEMRKFDLERLGTLSFPQLMREAYPGAVYYHMAKPYRVTSVRLQAKKVLVQPEKQYVTEPQVRPPVINPNLDGESIYHAQRQGSLRLMETDIYIQETVWGYKERRGGAEPITVSYPCMYWPRDRFTRNYFSSGVLITHPDLEKPDVQSDLLAELLLEGFLMMFAFERSDISCGTGRFKQAIEGLQGRRFIAIYDRVRGSLRLSSHLLEPGVLAKTAQEAFRFLQSSSFDQEKPLNEATIAVLLTLAEQGERPTTPDHIGHWPEIDNEAATGLDPSGDSLEEGCPVIMPGSMGCLLVEDNQEFEIEAVFLHPRDGLHYRGRRRGDTRDFVTAFPVDRIKPIPGESRMGMYMYETGEIREIP